MNFSRMKFSCSYLFVFFCWLYPSSASLEWWQHGVIYQIFPRSFQDSDGDGIGDLRGIEEKADYLKDLDIAAIWLAPIFDSPMVNLGYDVSNFTKISSIFGTMNDFISLKRKLDSLDIKLILDFVPNHTSNESNWFTKSVNRIDPFTNYYVWKNPSGWNGSTPLPPNNWVGLSRPIAIALFLVAKLGYSADIKSLLIFFWQQGLHYNIWQHHILLIFVYGYLILAVAELLYQ